MAMERISSRHIRTLESSSIKSPQKWLESEIAKLSLRPRPLTFYKGMQVKSVDLNDAVEFKTVNIENRTIEGYASIAKVDRGGDLVEPTAFKNSIDEYMTNPLCLYFHTWDKPIGLITDYKIDSMGLWVKVQVARGIKWIEEKAWPEIKQGIIRGFSFGYKTKQNEPRQINDRVINVIKELELLEISVVTIPMNSQTLFSTGVNK
jgi:HK97 family phage prohead protease